MVRTIFIKTNNFRRIRRALLAYVRCGGLALKGLNKLADDNQDKDPDVAQEIHTDFYVDDLGGSSTIEEAIHLRDGITSLLQTAGFELRKWASNSEQFLNDIPENSR